MAIRSVADERPRLGLETTAAAGTAVTPTIYLPSMSWRAQPQSEVITSRADGVKLITGARQAREWTTFDLAGTPSFENLTYLLASLIGLPAYTEISVGPPAVHESVFSLDSVEGASVQAPLTFSVEQGQSVQSFLYTYALLTGLSLEFSKAAGTATLSGQGIARKKTTGHTLSGTPANIGNTLISPSDFTVWIDDTQGGLGTTKFAKVRRVQFNLANRWAPDWRMDQSASYGNTFSAHVPTEEPELTAGVLIEADAATIAEFTHHRDGDVRYVRMKATGPDIDGSNNNELTIDMAGHFVEVPPYEEDGEVYAMAFQLQGRHDATWTKGLEITLQNEVDSDGWGS